MDGRCLIVEKPVTLAIPERWFQGVDLDQTAVMQEIVQLRIYQFKIRRTLKMYQAGDGDFFIRESVM
jgi:hypothetical protein